MIGIILSGHGNFASGMYSSVRLISGEQDHFEVVDFEAGMNAEDLSEELDNAIGRLFDVDDIVIFTDLAGGTPFNVSAKLSLSNGKVRVLAGVNAPLLLESCFKRELPIEDFLESALKSAKDGIRLLNFRKK